MTQLKAELTFLKSLISINLSSAMEYRAGFLSQIVGMFINNGIYTIFWVIFFRQFGSIRGYNVEEIFLLYAVVAVGHGLAFMFAGNTRQNMAYLVAQGRLDYYLVFPRNLLMHIMFSKMSVPGVGDVLFGLVVFALAGRFLPVEIGLFLVVSVITAVIFVGYGVITGSLAFYMGNAQYVSMQASNSLVTFSMYPNSLFSGGSRLILYTILPAAFVGAVPVAVIQGHNGRLLFLLIGVTVVIWLVALAMFYYGLRRYESGSAINVNI